MSDRRRWHPIEPGDLSVHRAETTIERQRINDFADESFRNAGVALSSNDRWIDHSILLMVKRPNDVIVGSCRLTLPSPESLLSLQLMQFSDSFRTEFPPEVQAGFAEIGNFCFTPRDPYAVEIIALLARGLLQCAIERDHLMCVAAVAPGMRRILEQRLGAPLRTVGPTQPYQNLVIEPVVLDVQAYLETERLAHPAMWEFMMRGVTIDIRDRVATAI